MISDVEFELTFTASTDETYELKNELSAFVAEFINLHEGAESTVPAYAIHWTIREESSDATRRI